MAFKSAVSQVNLNPALSAVISKPSSVVAGDMLIAHIAVDVAVTVTPPTGWSLVLATGTRLYTFTKTAGTSEPADYTFTFGALTRNSGILSDYTGVSVVAAQDDDNGNSDTPTAPSVSAIASDILLCVWAANSPTAPANIIPPSGMTERAELQNAPMPLAAADATITATGLTGTRVAQVPAPYAWWAQSLVLSSNLAPSAPTLQAPADQATVNRNASNIFSWTFVDSNPNDTQSAFNLRYRPTGTTTWVQTGWVTSATSSWTASAGTFAAGTYEWQVATRDQDGAEGPYSAPWTFTAATPPPGPAIVDPINGATIPSDQYLVTWSAPSQEAYQLQVLAADGTTVLFDTGIVMDTVTRSLTVDFPDNGATRIIRLSVQDAGLWSPWASVTVLISYSPPPAAIVSVTANPVRGSLVITPDFPVPVPPEPSVAAYHVWMRRVGTDGDGIRIARDLAPSQPWEWMLPASGVDYEFRVQGVGSNSTTSYSVWAPGVPVYNLVQNPRGRTTSGTVVVRENLASNPSLEVNSAGWVAYSGAVGTRNTNGGYKGAAYFSASADGLAVSQGLGYVLTTSGSGTFSARIALRISTPRDIRVWCRLNYSDGSGTEGQYTTVIPATSWGEFIVTPVAADPNKALSTISVFARSIATGAAFILDGDAVLIENGSSAGPYFDGSYSPDPDLTPTWTGTVDASPSQLLGPAPVGWAGGYYSTSTDAVKVPTSGSSVSVPSGAATLVAFDPTTGQTTYTPTTGGTVAIPGPATVRAAVVPGVYSGPYFDGDSLGAYWLGDPHESTSILYPVDG